jgi:DNA polymerase I-like protein with 3'-5' exonuclease and polymerase domains
MLNLNMFAVQAKAFDEQAWQRAAAAQVVAIDVETQAEKKTGTLPGPTKKFGFSYPAPMISIAVSWKEGSDVHSTSVWLKDVSAEQVKPYLVKLFAESVVVMHNAVFDARQLYKITSCAPRRVWDTMVMEKLLASALDRSYSLLEVAKARGVVLEQGHAEMKGKRDELDTVDPNEVLDYNEADTRVTLAIYCIQQTDAALMPELVDWECRAMRWYCEMAGKGIRLNYTKIDERLAELRPRIVATKARLAADGLSNPRSSAQVTAYIYDKKQIPKPENTPENKDFFTSSGALSASKEAIEALNDLYPEVGERLKDLTEYSTCLHMGTVLEDLLEHAAIDGRVHSLVTIATVTGRRASSNPNAQNWAMKAKTVAGDMCGVFIADTDDATLWEYDYSNAENWSAAMLAADSAFAKACAAEDFHEAMAASYFPQEWAAGDYKARKLLRVKGKGVTFGSAYGSGAKSIGIKLGISTEAAKELLHNKDLAFPRVAATKKIAETKAKREGFVNLWTGRKVSVKPQELYSAWNYVNQGGVGEMLKRSLALISEEFERLSLKSRIVLDMHDALIISVKHSEWEQVNDLVPRIMAGVMPEKNNKRTDPPIQWKAEQAIEKDKATGERYWENSRKWGMGQYHPPLPPEEKAIEPAQPQQVVIMNIGGTDVDIPIDSKRYASIKERIEALPQAAKDKALTSLNKALETAQMELTGLSVVQMPPALGSGYGNVDLANYRKVVHHWKLEASRTEQPVKLDEGEAWTLVELNEWFGVVSERIALLRSLIAAIEKVMK